ncbi:MAG: hypothetical protein IT304_03480 [Dehalococcoidia bacterium]|nr:hypothetical protein [Dehalococcoidia bacterium]
MPKRLLLLALAFPFLFALAACGDDDEPKPPATRTATAGTPTPVPTTVAPAATTARPSVSPSASATASVPADGTVDPLGPPSTNPVTTKPTREDFTGNLLLREVRIGVHPELGGWDRIVFEFTGTILPGATVAYREKASECGSGKDVRLGGTAVLDVRFEHAAAHDDAGKVTVNATQIQGPGKTIVEARQTCDFEGVVGWDMGVAGKQPFKVTTLTNPPRLVVDVKQ